MSREWLIPIGSTVVAGILLLVVAKLLLEPILERLSRKIWPNDGGPRWDQLIIVVVALALAPIGYLVGTTALRITTVDCPADATAEVIWSGPTYGGLGAVGDPEILVHLNACQTLMVTGRTFMAPDGSVCNGSETEVCVLMWRATRARDVRVGGLTPGHTWYGTSASDPAKALAWQAPNFWSPSNCSTGRGCDSAHVFSYLDGEPTQPFYLIKAIDS